MPYPIFLAGQGLRASQLAAMQPRYAVKTATEAVASSTTLQNDDSLTLPLQAGGVYEVEMVLIPAGNGSTAAAGDRGQFKTAWLTPAGSTGLKTCVGQVGPDRDSSLMRSSSHNFGTSVTYDLEGTGTASAVVEKAIVTVGGTAGDLTLQWAQAAVGATPTNLLTGSYLRVLRVS